MKMSVGGVEVWLHIFYKKKFFFLLLLGGRLSIAYSKTALPKKIFTDVPSASWQFLLQTTKITIHSFISIQP